MERQPCDINRVPKIRKVPHKITKKLGGGHKIDRRSSRKYEETIRSKKKESSKIKNWR